MANSPLVPFEHALNLRCHHYGIARQSTQKTTPVLQSRAYKYKY